MRVSPLYCLTLPLGAVLFAFILFRSTVVTLRQRGIFWRGTSIRSMNFAAGACDPEWKGLTLKR
jgi:hypothetical protein